MIKKQGLILSACVPHKKPLFLLTLISDGPQHETE